MITLLIIITNDNNNNNINNNKSLLVWLLKLTTPHVIARITQQETVRGGLKEPRRNERPAPAGAADESTGQDQGSCRFSQYLYAAKRRMQERSKPLNYYYYYYYYDCY